MPSSHASSDQAPDQSMSQGVLLTQVHYSLQCISGGVHTLGISACVSATLHALTIEHAAPPSR